MSSQQPEKESRPNFDSVKTLQPASLYLLAILSYFAPHPFPFDAISLIPRHMCSEKIRFYQKQSKSDSSRSLFSIAALWLITSDNFVAAARPLLLRGLCKQDSDFNNISALDSVAEKFRAYIGEVHRQRAFTDAVFLIREALLGNNERSDNDEDISNEYYQLVVNLKNAYLLDMPDERNFSSSQISQTAYYLCEMISDYQSRMIGTHSLEDLDEIRMLIDALLTRCDPDEKCVELRCTVLSRVASTYEALGKVDLALQTGREACDLVEQKGGERMSSTLSWLSNSMGCFYDTANQHERAKRCFEKARELWTVHRQSEHAKGIDCEDWPLEHKCNFGRCLVYLNSLPEAQIHLDEALADLHSKAECDEELRAHTLFAYAKLETRRHNYEKAQSALKEAKLSWVHEVKRKMHPFQGACLYLQAYGALKRGALEQAIMFVRESMEVTKLHEQTMPVEHGRNLFQLSEMLKLKYSGEDTEKEAQSLRQQAEALLRSKHPEVMSADRVDDYDQYIPIVWR